MKTRSAVGVLAFVLSFGVGQAQQIPPQFPVAGKSTFGVTGLYAPESELESPVGINPPTQNELLDHDYPPCVELDGGQFHARSGFRANIGIANYFRRISKDSTLRLSLYVVDSNRATIPAVAPLNVEHSGQAGEIVFAQRLGKSLDIGVAWVPFDKMDTKLSFGVQKVATGTAHSNFEGRVGVLWRHAVLGHGDQLRLGAVYGHESIKAEAKLSDGNAVQAFYQQVWVLGASYDPRPGTTLFWNKQKVTLQGEGLNESRPISYWGLQQFLSRQWVVRLSRVGPGSSVNIGYIGKRWEGYISFTDRAFSQVENLYGRGSLVFLSAVKKL